MERERERARDHEPGGPVEFAPEVRRDRPARLLATLVAVLLGLTARDLAPTLLALEKTSVCSRLSSRHPLYVCSSVSAQAMAAEVLRSLLFGPLKVVAPPWEDRSAVQTFWQSYVSCRTCTAQEFMSDVVASRLALSSHTFCMPCLALVSGSRHQVRGGRHGS